MPGPTARLTRRAASPTRIAHHRHLEGKNLHLAIAAPDAGTEQEVAAYPGGIEADPPTDRRVEWRQGLDWATAATESSADLVAAVSRGIATAVSGAGPAEQRL